MPKVMFGRWCGELSWSRDRDWVRTGVTVSRGFERGHALLYADLVKRRAWKIGPVGAYWLHFRYGGW